MGLMRNRFGGRFSLVGRLADVVLVGSTVLRYANRRGLVSDATARRLGAPDSSGGSGVSAAELAMAAAAALRLTGRFRASRKAKRA